VELLFGLLAIALAPNPLCQRHLFSIIELLCGLRQLQMFSILRALSDCMAGWASALRWRWSGAYAAWILSGFCKALFDRFLLPLRARFFCLPGVAADVWIALTRVLALYIERKS